MAAPCPFHHLPATETVWVDVDGYRLPYSAERACANWHTAAAIEPAVVDAQRAVTAAFDRTFGEEAR